jgi:hypothetical protein
MKLQILTKTQEAIGGFETLEVGHNAIDLTKIVDNECEVILASDILDCFTSVAMPQLVDALLTKLRLNGELVVGGTDIRVFSKAVTNGLISTEDASNVVTGVHSMTCCQQTREVLTKAGLEIQSVHIEGLHYELKVKRVK